jgi:hypothetical protein
VGTRWVRIASPTDAGGPTPPDPHAADKPHGEPLAGTDGADDVAFGFTWTCARRASALSCWIDPAHPIAIDGPVTAFALAADDASADLAVVRADGHADAVRLSGGKVEHVQRLADHVRAVFGTAGPACVATATELVCGRMQSWRHSDLPPTLATATHLAAEDDTKCGLVDHHVRCDSADTWLLGSGAAISDVPIRVAL